MKKSVFSFPFTHSRCVFQCLFTCLPDGLHGFARLSVVSVWSGIISNAGCGERLKFYGWVVSLGESIASSSFFQFNQQLSVTKQVKNDVFVANAKNTIRTLVCFRIINSCILKILKSSKVGWFVYFWGTFTSTYHIDRGWKSFKRDRLKERTNDNIDKPSSINVAWSVYIILQE